MLFPARPATALLTAALALAGASAHAQVALSGGAYDQSFDSMGTAGTAPPTGWSLYTGPTGTSNSTWTSSITASVVGQMVASSGALTAITSPTATNNNGYNAARLPSATSDRVIATSPTTTSGAAIQLAMSNQTGDQITGLNLSYDIVRFTAASSANELPGYQVFSSLDGTTWSNVTVLNPTLSTVPNTVGVTNVASTIFNLSAPVLNGQNFYLRWVDDNATQTSPDQILGLNNVSITPVPEPGTLAILAAGLAAAAWRRGRGRGEAVAA